MMFNDERMPGVYARANGLHDIEVALDRKQIDIFSSQKSTCLNGILYYVDRKKQSCDISMFDLKLCSDEKRVKENSKTDLLMVHPGGDEYSIIFNYGIYSRLKDFGFAQAEYGDDLIKIYDFNYAKEKGLSKPSLKQLRSFFRDTSCGFDRNSTFEKYKFLFDLN